MAQKFNIGVFSIPLSVPFLIGTSAKQARLVFPQTFCLYAISIHVYRAQKKLLSQNVNVNFFRIDSQVDQYLVRTESHILFEPSSV